MKRMLIIAVLLAVLVAPLANMTMAQEEVTIKILNWSQEQTDFYKEIATEFNKEFPNITVEWTTMAQAQYDEALPLMFQSGDSPDIFWYIGASPVLTLPELLDLDWVHPLVGMPEDWESRWPAGHFAEGVTQKDGEYYGFVLQDSLIWGHGYMYWNKDVFRAAGLDPDVGPATWSELREVCEAIRASGPYCLSVSIEPASELHRIWIPLSGGIHHDGFLDPKTGEYDADDPLLLEAFDFLQGLYVDDLAMPGLNDKAFARSAMGSGLAGIYFDGTWIPSVIKGMGFEDLDLGIALAPAPDGGRTGAIAQAPLSGVRGWISSQTEHPEAASQFIEWVTRPDGFYATEYVNRGFGTLAFAAADNIEDPGLAAIANLVVGSELRAVVPQPILKCPELANSLALQRAAEAGGNNAEYMAMQLALLEGGDYASEAAKIAATRNEAFLATLAEEGISHECFEFPEWDYTEDFTG